ncbi:MAG TPA: type VI secretion system transmembrane protein TssO [Mariniphaga sp.]|nr:type VI secretion system transmembrane protein TssO [Mariniphaga sp.]
MKTYTSLSSREKQYQFVYLLGMLILAIVLFCTIFLRRFESPFSESNTLETQMLEQKNKFAQQQSLVAPLLETSYRKISILQLETPQPFAENDIKNSINDVANSFENTTIYDTRKEGYLQIAQFYKMYFEDKKIAAKKAENITLFEKQFEECSIGFKDKEQQLSQKQNAMLSRSGQ